MAMSRSLAPAKLVRRRILLSPLIRPDIWKLADRAAEIAGSAGGTIGGIAAATFKTAHGVISKCHDAVVAYGSVIWNASGAEPVCDVQNTVRLVQSNHFDAWQVHDGTGERANYHHVFKVVQIE